jgi:hypothetical protein
MGQGECSIIFAYNGSQYDNYREQELIHNKITSLAGRRMVDAPLTLILPLAYLHYATIHIGIEHQ